MIGIVGEINLEALIRQMQPVLNPGAYVFCTLQNEVIPPAMNPVGMFMEKEGLSVIISTEQAKSLNLPYQPAYSWITLNVHSSLEAVGLTAVVSNALAAAGISCNMVAAFYHDHIFVPVKDSQRALYILNTLSKSQKEGNDDKNPSNIL